MYKKIVFLFAITLSGGIDGAEKSPSQLSSGSELSHQETRNNEVPFARPKREPKWMGEMPIAKAQELIKIILFSQEKADNSPDKDSSKS